METEAKIFLVLGGCIALFGSLFIYAMTNLAESLISQGKSYKIRIKQEFHWFCLFLLLIGLGSFVGAVLIS